VKWSFSTEKEIIVVEKHKRVYPFRTASKTIRTFVVVIRDHSTGISVKYYFWNCQPRSLLCFLVRRRLLHHLTRIVLLGSIETRTLSFFPLKQHRIRIRYALLDLYEFFSTSLSFILILIPTKHDKFDVTFITEFSVVFSYEPYSLWLCIYLPFNPTFSKKKQTRK